MEVFSIGYALLSMQRALLDAVTPELRAVVVDVCKETDWLYIRCYYDGDISEKLMDVFDCAITEASADFGPDCVLDNGVERVDYPQKIPLRGRYAYLRMEPNLFATEGVSKSSGTITREMIDFQEKVGVFVDPVYEGKWETNCAAIHHGKEGSLIIPAKPAIYNIDIFPLAYALLAIQRALLGLVIPQLRAVIVDLCREKSLLYIYFYYEGNLNEHIRGLWERAITEASACLGPGYILDVGIQRLDYPQEPPFRGRYAYLRKE